ncbi:TIGR03086 family metal-binding protein [Amycolatopsis taiwanensis]|uniref:Mycothiol-dependent maleylpyruvate isomerase metal-binding domain-containing protein n=1 Tax=Amycolatopsis taiwanensis TaxID=342230 RepID=A0A9W6QXM5_9PSEU|nr:TIGR03086 family metal-binding protein [Amycolatopsis taiwanensis]GLY64636.1 hypothetical protein Atai01_12550 [Amycolatopsis taiwanensis]
MTDCSPTALLGGVGLLERAISYVLGNLQEVRPESLDRPTPCRRWNLRALLAHLNDSLLALHEAAELGRVGLEESVVDGDPVELARARAGRLLGAWSSARSPSPVLVAQSPLTTGIVVAAGALEVAVHGWDVGRACGGDRPLPSALAEELLELAPFFVTDADRPIRFAWPAAAPPGATAGDQLLTFLGRHP